MNKVISTINAPKAIGPYSQAVENSNMVFISGQLGLEPATGTLLDGVEAQTKRAMENIKAILEAAGLEFSNIAKTTIFLTDMENFSKVNTIYEKYFSKAFPARSTIQVAALPKGGLVEIEVIAFS